MRTKKFGAVILALAMVALEVGCSDQWVKVALADLPVLTQMALNIATLTATLADGQQVSAADATTIKNISSQAGSDLLLLDTLYEEYKANASTGTLQKIKGVIADLNSNIPALLNAAHIANPVLSARVAAAVSLILTTVTSFATLLPQATPSTAQSTAKTKLATPKDLKRAWNAQVYPQFK